MNTGRASQKAIQRKNASAIAKARKRALDAVSERRRKANTAIRIAPAATAEARQELLISSPGVRTIASSIEYSIAGWIMRRTKAAITRRTAASIRCRRAGGVRLMNVVNRMWALRR